MTARYSILSPSPNTSTLLLKTDHSGTTLTFPVPKHDLEALIRAAFKAPDSSPRVSLNGVHADKMSDGVRLRNVAEGSWFDIPWSEIAQGTFDDKESA